MRRAGLPASLINRRIRFLYARLSLFPNILKARIAIRVANIYSFCMAAVGRSFFIFSLLYFVDFFVDNLLFSLFFDF